MDLYLVPSNPENTVLVSINGVAHYRVRTTKPKRGPHLTTVQRPAELAEDSIVAEIEWRCWEQPTIIRSPLLSGLGQCVGVQGVGVRALHYLYRRHRFSPSRYFIGDDVSKEQAAYTKIEVARFVTILCKDGLFAGERKGILRVYPCSIDIDLVVLTFIITEKKRRSREGYTTRLLVDHDEDPQGDGGGSGEGEGGQMGEL
ncbi:TonB box-containing protein [Crassisporium funariophilum]|nr:TonB box-containing protein [Crassisporium funariophilum]